MLHRYSLTTECTAPPGMVGRCVAPTEIANPFGIRDSSCLIVKGGREPPSHFAPGHAGSERSSLPACLARTAIRACGAEARERRPPGRHSPPEAGGSAYG